MPARPAGASWQASGGLVARSLAVTMQPDDRREETEAASETQGRQEALQAEAAPQGSQGEGGKAVTVSPVSTMTPVAGSGALSDHLLLMRDPYARAAITLLAGRIDRLEEGMATFDQDVQDLITAVKDNAQATADLAARVSADFAALRAQIAAGSPDPTLLASLESQIAAVHANTSALAAIDPAAPTPPPPPATVMTATPAPADNPAPPAPTG